MPKTTVKRDPEALFVAAVAKVQSKSIRDWAQSDRNKPIWIKHITQTLNKGVDLDSDRLAAFIVAIALEG